MSQTIPPLALATPNAAFTPEKVSYYRNTVAPRLYYLSPPLLAALGLFVGFVAWRLVRRCCRCCCQWCCITPTEVRHAHTLDQVPVTEPGLVEAAALP